MLLLAILILSVAVEALIILLLVLKIRAVHTYD